MNEDNFNQFFSNYSKSVDSAARVGFWKLSDAIIREILRRHIPRPAHGKVILDAGGGTGRWICNLSKEYSSDFVLFDRSKDMIEKAQDNIRQAGITARVCCVHGNLEDMSQVESESVDYVISIYNPLSFVGNPDAALSEIARITKSSGTVMVMVQGYYNALFSKINNYLAPVDELEQLHVSSFVLWADHVPPLRVFSLEVLQKHFKDANLNWVKGYGLPVLVQPGQEDFDPQNESLSRISTALEGDPRFFEWALDTELKYNHLPSIINRGMNLLGVGQKQ